MNVGLIFFQILPALLFILFRYWRGFKSGIIAAMAGAILMVGYCYFAKGNVDYFTLGEAGLILIFGAVSLWMGNERFFKFQPTVSAGILVLLFTYFEVRGTPFLVEYIPRMQEMFDAEDPSPRTQAMLAQMETPLYRKTMANLSFGLIGLFLIHGLAMTYAALYLSTSQWFAWRLSIYPGFVLLMIIVGVVTR